MISGTPNKYLFPFIHVEQPMVKSTLKKERLGASENRTGMLYSVIDKLSDWQ